MSEDMNKELETEVKAEEPVETMEDYAAELEASYAALDQRRDMPEDDSAEGQKWAEFAQMMEDKTVLKVKISEAVKGGVVAFVDEVRAFIPASQLSADYVAGQACGGCDHYSRSGKEETGSVWPSGGTPEEGRGPQRASGSV